MSMLSDSPVTHLPLILCLPLDNFYRSSIHSHRSLTSLNSRDISPIKSVTIGIIGHFINKDGKCWQVVLGLREIVNEYTSKNMVGVFIDLFCDYGITNNIG